MHLKTLKAGMITAYAPCICSSPGAGSMVKGAAQVSRVEPTGLRLTTSPSMEHFSVRSDSVDSLASMDVMHDTDDLVSRRPMTLLPL